MCAKPIFHRPKTQLQPPGTKLPNSGNFQMDEDIIFNLGYESTELLPPLARVNIVNEPNKTYFAINIIAFVNSTIVKPITSFEIYYEYGICNLGKPQLTFYVSYTNSGNQKTKTYNAYHLNTIEFFVDNSTKKTANTESVRVFLWNDDPETSRGTVTTVPNL
ncbi:hypothetical protein [Aquimarina algiphila]|uniref:hypothetical protein n=1 Tax=Aquimarina algiphila TaxID=2047982 RepID=UPI00232C2949|nr:hypothetical protein [Aquimarina algiphila]